MRAYIFRRRQTVKTEKTEDVKRKHLNETGLTMGVGQRKDSKLDDTVKETESMLMQTRTSLRKLSLSPAPVNEEKQGRRPKQPWELKKTSTAPLSVKQQDLVQPEDTLHKYTVQEDSELLHVGTKTRTSRADVPWRRGQEITGKVGAPAQHVTARTNGVLPSPTLGSDQQDLQKALEFVEEENRVDLIAKQDTTPIRRHDMTQIPSRAQVQLKSTPVVEPEREKSSSAMPALKKIPTREPTIQAPKPAETSPFGKKVKRKSQVPKKDAEPTQGAAPDVPWRRVTLKTAGPASEQQPTKEKLPETLVSKVHKSIEDADQVETNAFEATTNATSYLSEKSRQVVRVTETTATAMRAKTQSSEKAKKSKSTQMIEKDSGKDEELEDETARVVVVGRPEMIHENRDQVSGTEPAEDEEQGTDDVHKSNRTDVTFQQRPETRKKTSQEWKRPADDTSMIEEPSTTTVSSSATELRGTELHRTKKELPSQRAEKVVVPAMKKNKKEKSTKIAEEEKTRQLAPSVDEPPQAGSDTPATETEKTRTSTSQIAVNISQKVTKRESEEDRNSSAAAPADVQQQQHQSTLDLNLKPVERATEKPQQIGKDSPQVRSHNYGGHSVKNWCNIIARKK